MAYPDLYSDESVLLNAQNIKVKSVTFEAVLTNRRLILVDSKKHLLAPQEILLATLKNVESGENAIRDPTITLSLITNSGATRQMILTFSKASGGDRKRESDEWIRLLRQNLAQPFQQPAAALHDISSPVPEPAQYGEPPVAPQKVPIANAPQPKKKIEIARPIMKIVETPPAMPKPIETTSLPVGSFCNRCGNRVPPESAFCNRCGTPVVRDPDQIPSEPPQAPPAEPAPAPAEEVPPQPVATPIVQSPPAPQPPAPPIPQLHVPIPAPVFGTAAGEVRKERPIEQVIHSIEPLIEDSKPRTEEAPLIPKPASLYAASAPAVEETPAPAPAAATAPAETAPAAPESTVAWPVIGQAGTSPATDAPAAAAPEAPAPVPPQVPPQPKKAGTGKIIAIAVAVIVILAVIGSAVLFLKPQETPAAPAITPATTAATTIPTPVVTETAVPVATVPVTAAATPAPTDTSTAVSPQASIPSSGVWIRITYPGVYSAAYGTPGAESTRTDSGEHTYQIFTNTGIVVASVQKVDASGRELQVEIYKDGSLVTKKSTSAPKGIVEIQTDLKPTPAPTTIAPVTTETTATVPPSAGGNATANQTASAT